MILTIFYGTLAALALWASYWDEDLRWLGAWLVIGFLLSTALYLYVPITSWPGPYTLIEIMVALAAYCAWGARPYRALIVVVAVNLASIGVNIYFASAGPAPSDYQKYVFVLGTNICFAVECLLVLGIGVAHGYRTGRFTRRIRLGRFSLEPNAARKIEP